MNDLLDVSRVARGSFTLRQEQISIDELMGSAVEAARPAFDARQHTLKFVRASRDARRGRRSSDSGAKQPARQGDKVNGLRRDDHLDVPPRVAWRRIFSGTTALASHQTISHGCPSCSCASSPTAGNAEGGLGIGLALAKALVELHGGSIAARSAGVGQGSEFVVFLPRGVVGDRPVDLESSVSSTKAPESRRVLVADHNRDDAETMQLYLQMHGQDVHVAFNGSDALSVAERIRPEVAVVDMGLPDMSGYDVARRMRDRAWGRGVLLIALIGWGQESDKLRALAAGFHRHCTQPVDPYELERCFPCLNASPAAIERRTTACCGVLSYAPVRSSLVDF